MPAVAPIREILRSVTVTIPPGDYQDFWYPPQVSFRPISVLFEDPTNTQMDISGSDPTIYNSGAGGGANSHWVTNINQFLNAWYILSAPAQVIRLTNNGGAPVWVDLVGDAWSAPNNNNF